ncbi:MAG: hypothetical protein KAV83_00825 [Desulfobacterales bacterium]|nr:hypothetical protein [Desulfobacterales bacterium]
MRNWLGDWLEKTRIKHAKIWMGVFITIMAALVIFNLFIRPHHVEFGYDAYCGFWAVFGLGVCLLMVFVMKKIVQPFLAGPEDSYDSNE